MSSDVTMKEIKALLDEELEAMFDALSMTIMIEANTETALRNSLIKELISTKQLNAGQFAERLQTSRDGIASTQYAKAFDLEKLDGLIDVLRHPEKSSKPDWLRGVLDGGKGAAKPDAH